MSMSKQDDVFEELVAGFQLISIQAGRALKHPKPMPPMVRHNLYKIVEQADYYAKLGWEAAQNDHTTGCKI